MLAWKSGASTVVLDQTFETDRATGGHFRIYATAGGFRHFPLAQRHHFRPACGKFIAHVNRAMKKTLQSNKINRDKLRGELQMGMGQRFADPHIESVFLMLCRGQSRNKSMAFFMKCPSMLSNVWKIEWAFSVCIFCQKRKVYGSSYNHEILKHLSKRSLSKI